MSTELADRVAHLRQRLATAGTIHAARQAISEFDNDVLRVVEADYVLVPGDIDTLRERLAAYRVLAHRCRDLRSDTRHVGARVVTGWAVTVLREFLTGFTDFTPELGGQYQIRHVQTTDTGAPVVEVRTFAGHHPRRFRIDLEVQELPSRG